MYTPIQSIRLGGSAGKPIPTVFKSLESAGVQFLQGQLVLISAGPGTGKSGFTLTLALKAKVPCFYFSADSGTDIQLARMISILTGMLMGDATSRVRAKKLGDVADALAELPIRFSYDASPSLDQIERSLAAYEEIYGEYPALVVVDNITNVRTDSAEDDDPFSGLEGLMDYLHVLARTTGACVVGLHHVTGPYNDAGKPIPLSGVKGQIGRVPELILTQFKQVEEGFPDSLCVSAVKNRGGRADPSGNTYVELQFDGDHFQITDLS